MLMYLVLDFHFYIRTLSNQTVSRVKKPRSYTPMLNKFKYILDFKVLNSVMLLSYHQMCCY